MTDDAQLAFIMGLLHSDDTEAARMTKEWDNAVQRNALAKVKMLISVATQAPELRYLTKELKKGLDAQQPVELTIASMPLRTGALQIALVDCMPTLADRIWTLKLMREGYAGLTEEDRIEATGVIPHLHAAATELLKVRDFLPNLVRAHDRITSTPKH